MAEDLWVIRRRKKMNVKALSARSGVPVGTIHDYEAGKMPISARDLPRLARALYVDKSDIKTICSPKPRDSSRPYRPPRQGPPSEGEPRPPRKPREPRPAGPARPSQIEHLVTLAQAKFGLERDALEAEVGKPLDQLTYPEAKALLVKYQTILREHRAAAREGGPKPEGPEPVPFNRRRSHLPEGVDGFENEYLTQQQEAGTVLDFTLFDNTQIKGRVIGYSPYTITLQNESGDEVTLNKMAIAYYRKEAV